MDFSDLPAGVSDCTSGSSIRVEAGSGVLTGGIVFVLPEQVGNLPFPHGCCPSGRLRYRLLWRECCRLPVVSDWMLLSFRESDD